MITKTIVATAAAMFAVATAAQAQTAASPSFGNTSLACKGINACKGQSACKSGANACKGMNACKGQGWVEARSRLACQGAGGASVGF
jgi:hypothetical protein